MIQYFTNHAGFVATAITLLPASAVTVIPLIEGPESRGNGDFFHSQEGAAVRLGLNFVGQTFAEDSSRDRALIQHSSANGTQGHERHGIRVLGWTVSRVVYAGGNAVIGLDGTFGFGTVSGEGGQAFVNSGTALLESRTFNHSFDNTQSVTVSYLLGSDHNGDTGVATAIPSLLFDAGLSTESSFALPTATRTGLNRATNLVTEMFAVPSDFSTLQLNFEFRGGDVTQINYRGLIDQVRLDVVTPEPSSALLLSIGGVLLLRRKRR